MCACNYINFIPVFPCHCLSAVHYSISYYWEKHVNIPCVCVCLCISSSVMSDYLWPHGLQPTRLLCSWNSLEWVAISFSRESSRPRDQTWVSCIAGRHSTVWATREALWFNKGWLLDWGCGSWICAYIYQNIKWYNCAMTFSCQRRSYSWVVILSFAQIKFPFSVLKFKKNSLKKTSV